MEKEKILMQAQQENHGKDVADLDAQRRGAYIAYFVGLVLIIAWDVVEGIVVSSVVPTINFTIDHMLQNYFGKSPLFVAPMQDILELGSEARMNTPGAASGNNKRWS